MSRRTVVNQILDFLQFRVKRLYNTFYHSQYTGKLTLVFILPTVLCAIRYRAETKFGYHIFIDQPILTPKPRIPAGRLISIIPGIEKYCAWKNGSKVYFNDDVTVAQIKKKLLSDANLDDVLVGCRGRVFRDTDNVASAVRSFCKLDHKLIIWRDNIVSKQLTLVNN